MSIIQEDSYWFTNTNLPPHEQKMQAMCGDCYQEKKIGWHWKGSELGYGDYDMKCALCGKILHQREEEYDDENTTAISD